MKALGGYTRSDTREPALYAGWNRWPLGDPGGVEVGTFYTAWSRDPETGLEAVNIIEADPRIVVSDEFLVRARRDRLRYERWEIGAVVEFVGDNRTAVYRVAERDIESHVWLLVWPD